MKAIRAQHERRETSTSIALRYGVSLSLISQVVNRKRWEWVE